MTEIPPSLSLSLDAGRHDRPHRHASFAPGAARDVHLEGAAQEGGPIHAGKRRVERAAKESSRCAMERLFGATCNAAPVTWSVDVERLVRGQRVDARDIQRSRGNDPSVAPGGASRSSLPLGANDDHATIALHGCGIRRRHPQQSPPQRVQRPGAVS